MRVAAQHFCKGGGRAICAHYDRGRASQLIPPRALPTQRVPNPRKASESARKRNGVRGRAGEVRRFFSESRRDKVGERGRAKSKKGKRGDKLGAAAPPVSVTLSSRTPLLARSRGGLRDGFPDPLSFSMSSLPYLPDLWCRSKLTNR